ncbi:MAG: NADH-quinone oxidoreductase subunit N [Chloroflexi bacterium]|nr:NADH-quinone oxidoreductase subunit N [Chloroflexota bacterium]MYF79321.1 NADH-quinone oxidoreductase subunit N [Chloroflexota bacterium]MYK62214.1 NADH-quinone oxidoreductase subunit N [Chloroflexota bacterium]
MTAQDYWALSPVIAMAALALVLLSADALLAERMFGGKRYGSKRALSWIAVIGLAVPAFLALNLWFEWFGESTSEAVVYGTFTADRFALFFQFLIIGATGVVILASVPYLQQFRDSLGEFFTLLLTAAAGMMLLVGASELITIYVALETTALPAVALAALRRDGFSIEAGAKFLILSALSTALLLFGLVFLYGYTGATRIDEIVARMGALPFESGVPFGSLAVMLSVLLIVAGFGFKMAIAPWHMWVPDVYQGSPTPVAAFLSVASKASAFAVLMRLLYSFAGFDPVAQDWQILFALIATASMTVGNLMALSQTNVKRLLAYSTIAQAGYIMVGFAAVSVASSSDSASAGPQSIMYYLAGYAFTNLAVFLAFAAIVHRTGNDTIAGLSGLLKRSPVLAILMVIGLLSLLGMPPTVGFMAKAVIFSTAVDQGLIWLAVVAVVNTVVAAYYYLRVVGVIMFGESDDADPIKPGAGELAAVSIGVAGALVFGIVPWFILELVDKSLTIV